MSNEGLAVLQSPGSGGSSSTPAFVNGAAKADEGFQLDWAKCSLESPTADSGSARKDDDWQLDWGKTPPESEVSTSSAQDDQPRRADEKRRSSLERYRPGAYFNEEREKHRRRGHFGENRLVSSGNGGPDVGSVVSNLGGDDHGGRSRAGKGRGNKSAGGRSGRNNRDRRADGRHENREGDDGGEGLGDGDQARHPLGQRSASKPLVDLRHKLNEKRQQKQQGYHDQHHQQQLQHRDQQQQQHRDQQHQQQHRDQLQHREQQQQHHRDQQQHRDRQEQVQKQQQPKQNPKPLARPKRNTENFSPSHAPPEMRLLAASPGLKVYDRLYSSRDVVVVRDLFPAWEEGPSSFYDRLVEEMDSCGVDRERLWQSWHGDSHVIADDNYDWKAACPTFCKVVDAIGAYFRMDVKATRLNWYRDSTEWKPFHHDAAAVKPNIARKQNFTAAVSFGAERDVAFEHVKTKTIISMPQPSGTVYTFGRDVNILWRHGIPQVPPELQNGSGGGRISIILWGWVEQFDLPQ